MVWLKDMTRRFQTYKRTLSEGDLPDQLSFRLKRKSHSLTLNLRKNYDIDPNADIYIVQNLDDGRSVLERAQNLEKENGNIRIRGRNYDLRPMKEVVTSRTSLETADLLGKQYVLLDQSYIKRDMTVQSEDVINDIENNIEEKLKELPQNVSHGQDEQGLRADTKLSFQNLAGIRNTFQTEGDMSGSNDKDGMVLSHSRILRLRRIRTVKSVQNNLFR
ncbi:hypothetical protein CHS0354_031935 [Potamilus streckersoni]|uniref:Uncharacterized protein n=1 Tax=Potamilus streckersoni TaxID=2493646 RepID=A0AAE0W1Z7_9BIVA|nr:hypothetical protein CHS0354_031935 [Potamilus streckersoni]